MVVPIILTYSNTRQSRDAIDAFLANTELIALEAQTNAQNPDGFYQNQVDFTEISSESGVEDPNLVAVPSEIVNLSDNTQATQGPAQEPARASSPSDDTQAAEEPNQASSPGAERRPLMSKEEIQRRMIGVLIIDKIDVLIPLMDGVDEETLRVSAGRMPQSGALDAIGNAGFAGHRSYTFGRYFNRLDEMKVGDTFVLKTGSRTLQYEVFKTFIVEPTDFSILNFNDTDKIVTLFTCHPVVVASHRLVVQAIQTN